MNDMSAAYLWGQLEKADEINSDRLKSWNLYHNKLQELSQKEFIELPTILDTCTHNAHMFYIKVKDLKERVALLQYLIDNGIWSVFHYVPLHSSKAGKKYGRFFGKEQFTTKESERLIRLPMYYGLSKKEIFYIVNKIEAFYETK